MGLLCIVLAWVIFEESRPSEPSAGAAPATGAALQVEAEQNPPPPVVFPMPDKKSLEVILERPVFSQTRRPSAEVGDGTPASSIDFTLSGVVISAGERSAMIRPGDGGPPQQLREGENFAGWTLVEVATDRVIVRRDALEAELFLDYAAPAPPGPRTEARKDEVNGTAQQQQDEQPMNGTDNPEAEPDQAPEN